MHQTSIQFSVTKVEHDRYKIIASDAKKILRSYEMPDTLIDQAINAELNALEVMQNDWRP